MLAPIMLKSSYYGGALAARGNKFTSRGKLRPQIRTYHYSSKVPNPLVHSEVDSGAMGVPVPSRRPTVWSIPGGPSLPGRSTPPISSSIPTGRGGLLHTSCTPLAHLWHTSGTPLACLACTPGGSPRLPPEKNTQTPQRDHHLPQPEEKIHIQGETLPPP